MRYKNWTQVEDSELRGLLEKELKRIRGASSPKEILGRHTDDDLRRIYLGFVKLVHPARFARRPQDIREDVGEVFLCLKEARDVISAELSKAQSSKPKESPSTKSQSVKISPPKRITVKSEHEKSVAKAPRVPKSMHQKIQERRREELRKKLSTGSTKTKRTAQIRAITADDSPDKKGLDEKCFEQAVNLVKRSDFEKAASMLSELASRKPSDKRFRLYMHYAQGRVFQGAENHEEARGEYKRALGLDAGFAQALRAMASLPGKTTKKDGLFRKIFKK